ncbi:MAG: DUF4159 domain-containing protein [Robiginitomaculum sp.]|nr:DUF4159 domain-containing protein [Robiginitomaculum sp.]
MSGSLFFLQPLLLAGLVLLPLFWLLLSALPPEPVLRLFPPIRILRDLQDETAIPQKIPLWLRLLRMLMIVLVILALAGPIIAPPSEQETDRPILLVIDDGWANAANWPHVQQSALALASNVDLEKQAIAMVFSTRITREPVTFAPFAEIETQINNHQPQPFAPKHLALSQRLQSSLDQGALPQDLRIYWLSDGLDYGGASALTTQLAQMGELHVLTDLTHDPIRITGVEPSADGVQVRIQRQNQDGPFAGAILAEDQAGQVLARQAFSIPAGEKTSEISLSLPLELRNRMGAVRIENVRSAAAVHLLDSSWARPRIGVVGGRSRGADQPLLSEQFYLEKALAPFAEMAVLDLSADPTSTLPPIIVLLDTGQLSGQAHTRLSEYVQNGGLLIRFAGPRLAERQDDLIPVPLRSGGRLLGSSLGWDQPQQLASFGDTSPFFGLDASRPINVTRQVLADSTPGLASYVWARLADGTPLVTSAVRGRGRIVLFHVTASPDWSELPLSGVFVDMLKRILPMAVRPTTTTTGERELASRVDLTTALSATGKLVAPDGSHQILDLAKEARPVDSAFPAGLWSNPKRSISRNVLEHLSINDFPDVPAGVQVGELARTPPVRLSGFLIGITFILLVLDSLAILWLAGKLPSIHRLGRGAMSAVLLVFSASFIMSPSMAQANELAALQLIERTRLAYVTTENRRVDEMSHAGLLGLSRELYLRTTVEPGAPLPVHLETDNLSVVSFLYWPILNEVSLSDHVVIKLNAYLKNGGMLILDTQDAGLAAAAAAGGVDPALASLFAKIDIPGLRQIPNDHVLTRAYYLTQVFPGRYANAPVWVEADRKGSSLDGVSSLVIGSHDWSAAWAINADGKPKAAVSDEIPQQREMARRFGINLVMYGLTGNYKADQVHIPALLERLNR